MQAQSSRPVKTFSIGFEEKAYNEAEFAAQVAHHLGTEHTELYAKPADALALVQRLPHYYDEPFSDSSQIPTMMVCALARRHVTVALSGDGGDELFAGYDRYSSTERLWKTLSKIPRAFRVAAGAAVRLALPLWHDGRSQRLVPPLPSFGCANLLDRRRMEKLALMLPFRNIEAFYQVLVSHAIGTTPVVLGARELPTKFNDVIHSSAGLELIPSLMYLDSVSYLPDDILTKVDRASMAVGLEARVPLLDHRVVEFAWTLPPSYKLRNGVQKWILKQLAYRYIPHEMLDRPKAGFAVPLARWLRCELRDWAEAMLDESRLRREGFFNVRLVRGLLKDQLSGKARVESLLWDLLMFQAWREETGHSSPSEGHMTADSPALAAV
jgi:asparagine synthase (glutamine-hydrolysing)